MPDNSSSGGSGSSSRGSGSQRRSAGGRGSSGGARSGRTPQRGAGSGGRSRSAGSGRGASSGGGRSSGGAQAGKQKKGRGSSSAGGDSSIRGRERSVAGGAGSGKSTGAKRGQGGSPSSRAGGKRGQEGRGSSERRSTGRPRGTEGVGADSARSGDPKARRDLKGAAVNLPRWVVEDLARVTPAPRVAGALEALGAASEALADSRHHAAVKNAQKAKELAPRDATVRETLGIALYRTGQWAPALSELRAYRRIAGETTHLPVEMDILRALDRGSDVEAAYRELERRGGKPAVMKEGRVVYASYLIDEERVEEALALTDPTRLGQKPFPEDLRVWYVAARAAALLGKSRRAGELRNAILENDPAFPGIDDLETLISRLGD